MPLDYDAEKWHTDSHSYNIVFVHVANKVFFTGVVGKTKSCS